ncbi:unnamed protein product [Durusdinium trenchii]|uniref:TRUD domain-containing protein n=1 Tax=Durusdinium trenchii TaxID=1381693 RepID=A0ABP0HU13_9DINO
MVSLRGAPTRDGQWPAFQIARQARRRCVLLAHQPGAPSAQHATKLSPLASPLFFVEANYTGAGASAERLILSVLESFGVSRASVPEGARLVWANCFEAKLWASAGHCFINHFPRSVELSHKHRLCATLRLQRCLPRSFVLPKERFEFLQAIWGTVKARYEDFVVKEVSQEGQVVELEDVDLLGQWERWKQSAGAGPVARMVLAKENRDVADARAMLARSWRLRREDVHVHGLKDRRGITYQHVSVPWSALGPKHFPQKGAVTWDPAVQLGDLRRQEEHCRLGALQGNQFTIALRDVEIEGDGQRLSGLKLLQRPVLLNERLRSATEQLRRFGFVNYFGQQRLGGSRRSGPEIGRAIITQDYELACELIVCSMHEATSEFQEAFRAGRYQALLNLMPRRCGMEREVLRHLWAAPSVDFAGAVRALQTQQLLLFVRSFTSDLWNRVLGRRLSAFGSDVLPGDLVYDKASLVPEHRGPPKVRRIEPGETALITDVLLPIAGPREWHENLSVLMRQIYQEVLQEHDLSMDELAHLLGPLEKNHRATAYRHCIVQPRHLSARALCYHEPAERFFISALDRLKGRSVSHDAVRPLWTEDAMRHAAGHCGPEWKVCVVVEMTLASGQYATVALREFMRSRPLNEA